MRIAIDARKLHDGGIGTYIRNLLREHARAPEGNEYVALVAREDLASAADLAAGEHALEASPVQAGKYSLAEHWAVPAAARRAGVGLLHEPHFTLPLFWSGPSVVTIHDLTHILFPHLFRPGAAAYARAVAGSAARRARLVLTVSEAAGEDITRLLRVPRGHLRVIPLAVSDGIRRRPAEEVAAFREARGLPGEYLLYVGALRRHKNVELLVEALRYLPPSAPPLVIASEPCPEDHPLAAAARRAGVTDRVRFAGAVRGEEELSLLYSGAGLYVHPSITESFGLPPLEAMACGVPVLSSDGGGLPLTLGDAAAFLPPANPGAWAEAIGALLGDAGRRDEMARRGLEWVRRYSWQRTAALTRAAYREAMAGG